MAFDTQITDLVGGEIDQTACDQWAADACKEIIHQLPANLKEKCSTVSLLNNSATTMDLDGVGDILYVTRLSANSGGFQVPCREIPSKYGGLATDSSDLNYYGTASDPVFWIQSNTSDAGTLFVKPDPDATQVAYVHHITYPSVNVSDVSTIANFPDEAEHLVVLYVATRQLLQYMSSTTLSTFSLSASAPSAPTIATVSYTDATNADASATAVGAVTVGTVAKAAMDGNVPTYTKPAFTSSSAFLTEMEAGTIDNAASDVDFEHWFSIAGQYIDSEDLELASSHLQKITTFLNAYQADMQNELNEFNKENVRYQANVQAEITKANADLQKVINQANIDAQDARQEAQQATNIDQFNKAQDQALNLANAAKQMEDIIANNNSLLQKFNSEISKYSASVNGEVQAYTQQVVEKTNEYQWYGDQYAKLSAEYQRGLAALKGA